MRDIGQITLSITLTVDTAECARSQGSANRHLGNQEAKVQRSELSFFTDTGPTSNPCTTGRGRKPEAADQM